MKTSPKKKNQSNSHPSQMSAEDKIQNLESRIEAIEKRNREVETNKSWEGSWTRKLLVGIFTYLSIALYFYFILEIDPWLNAIVPTLGFLLSTLTLPYFTIIAAIKKTKYGQ